MMKQIRNTVPKLIEMAFQKIKGHVGLSEENRDIFETGTNKIQKAKRDA